MAKVWEWLGITADDMFDRINVNCDKCPVKEECYSDSFEEAMQGTCGEFLAKKYEEAINK